MASEDELEGRIKKLPQELQDEILEFFLVVTPETIQITSDYKRPVQLQINRAIRKKSAEEYYATNTFRLRHDSVLSAMVRGNFWLVKLSQEHRAAIKTIEIDDESHRPDKKEIQEILHTGRDRSQQAEFGHWLTTMGSIFLRQDLRELCDIELKVLVLKWKYLIVRLDSGAIEEWWVRQ